MLRDSPRASMRRGQSSRPILISLLTATDAAPLFGAPLPSRASEQRNGLVSSCTGKKGTSQKGTAPGPAPALRAGTCGLGTQTHRGLQGQEVSTQGDLLLGSTIGPLPSPPMEPCGPRHFQPSQLLLPQGWRDEGKPQVAKITLSQGKAHRRHDAGICLSGAALPRWILKEPRHGRAYFPAVFTPAEPPAPLRPPASPAVPARAQSLALPPPAVRRPSVTSAWGERRCIFCHLTGQKRRLPSTPCIPLVAKGGDAQAWEVPGASCPSLSHLISATRAGAHVGPLLTASLNFSSVMSLRLIMTLK